MSARFDVIVVGGGTAGCVLAARLSEEPERTVGLVEAGPDYGRYAEGNWPSDMLDARILPMSHLWESDPADRSASRARILGGCSAHNACLVVWGSRADYDEWGDGWTFSEFEPYLRRAEARSTPARIAPATCRRSIAPCSMPGRASAYRGSRTPQRSRRHRRPRTRCRQLRGGSSLEHRLRVPRRRTVPAEPHDPLRDTRRSRRDRRRTGAGGRLRPRSVAAGTVIVSAGAYGSPALLLRSGIGPGGTARSRRRRRRGPPRRSRPRRSSRSRHRVGSRPAHVPDGGPVFATSLLVRARSDSCPRPRGTSTSCHGSTKRTTAGGRARSSTCSSRTRAEASPCARATRGDPPSSTTASSPSHTTSTASRAASRSSAPSPSRRARTRAPPGDQDSLDTYLRREVRGIFHPTGTCAIGAVVDTRGAVLGVDGLLVADASIMPTIPRANTNLSTVAVAERIADWLRA